MTEESEGTKATEWTARSLRLTTLGVELALLLVGLLLIWLTGVEIRMASSWSALGWGVVVALAASACAVAVLYWRGPVVAQLQRDIRLLVQHFGRLSIWDLALISILAGTCEEVLFRGFLQVWLSDLISPLAGLLLAALLFGLTHAISLSYAIFITLVGIALSGLFHFTGSLASVMLAHGLYDFVALVYLTRFYRWPADDETHADGGESEPAGLEPVQTHPPDREQ